MKASQRPTMQPDQFLSEIKRITSEFGFDALLPSIGSIENLAEKKLIEIAILGQFKAGKSSLINNLLDKKVLPTGVIPVTSVITKIIFGNEEKTMVVFDNGKSETINPSEIKQYITEGKNPDNFKGIRSATVELTEPDILKGLCITDTPGLGSVYLNSTKTTKDKLADTSVAVVCISAERPLSEADLELIRELKSSSYQLVCLLTKVDLFTEDQREEIESFLKRSLEKETGEKIPVYRYSIYENSGFYRNQFIAGICRPLSDRIDRELPKIYNHRLHVLAERCIGYLDMAREASMRSDEERDQLKARIFDEKVNTKFIRHELNLIATDSKSKIRERIFELLDPYSTEIINELQNEFREEYSGWSGNLYKISRNYEKWLQSALSEKLGAIVHKEKPAFDELLENTASHFRFFTTSLKDRIYQNVKQVLGIELKTEDSLPEFRPMKRPDTSIYTAFDTPIDLLWFLFPMVLFGKIFGQYFLRQIPREVSKNIRRLTSNVTGIINKETDVLTEATFTYILNELNTIEKALTGEQSRAGKYQRETETLRQMIQSITY